MWPFNNTPAKLRRRSTQSGNGGLLSIVLGNEADLGAQSETNEVMMHPGDTIRGVLKLWSKAALKEDDICVFLGGVTRTWTNKTTNSTNVSALEHKFLKQAQRLSSSTGEATSTHDGNTCEIPFTFTLPRHCPDINEYNEPLSRLPPSFQAGEKLVAEDGRQYMQPMITYSIRARVRILPPGSRVPVFIEKVREIYVVPLQEPNPPIDVCDFPTEFNRTSAGVVKKNWMASAALGRFRIAMDEPTPLRLHTAAKKAAASEACITLAFLPSSTALNPVLESCTDCTVDFQIISKTHYSTRPLFEMPNTSCLLKNHRDIKLACHIVSSTMRKAKLGTWTQNGSPPPRNSVDTSTSWGSQRSGVGEGEWTCTLRVPIECAADLTPSFCTPLASRSYALKATLRIKGLHHEALTVVLPLQVNRCREEGQRDSGSSNASAAASWFDAETRPVLSDESPPDYVCCF